MNTMRRDFQRWMPVFVGIGFSTLVYAEALGNLAQYPTTGINLTITAASDGMPILKPMELRLFSGKYYRLTIECPT